MDQWFKDNGTTQNQEEKGNFIYNHEIGITWFLTGYKTQKP